MKALPLALFFGLAMAGVAQAQTTRSLKKVIELKMPGTTGSNGAAVAWHPVQKKYYASMAGNASYPLGVFDTKGKLLSPEEQAALFDIRGFWYNSNTKTLQMNGYSENGWAEYHLDASGIPTEVNVLKAAMIQPTEQSCGAFNAKENVLYFLNDDGNIEKYSWKDAIYVDAINLFLGSTKKEEDAESGNFEVIDAYNGSTVIYTGTAGEEIGVLNHENAQVELYNLKTGLLVKKLAFPTDAPVPQFLNFSFSNGIYWLFDKEARTWLGYK